MLLNPESETEALINIRDHAPSRGCVVSILGIAHRHQGLLAKDPNHRAPQNQPIAQTAAPRPVRRNPSQSEQAKRRVDRMPDVPIWSATHQASFSRISHHMVTAPTEGYPRPKEQQKRHHL